MASILIVDDELDEARVVWGDPLRGDYGWDVAYAGGYMQAIGALSAACPDVVLLDRQMPDPKNGQLRKEVGDELLEEIVARWPDVCVIMLTHNADVRSAKRDTHLGAYDYFDKRVSHEELNAACRHGMRWNRIKAAREKLLELQSAEAIFQAVTAMISEKLDTLCVAYIELTPSRGFLLRQTGCSRIPDPPIFGCTDFFADAPADREFLFEIIASRRLRFVHDAKRLSQRAALSKEPAIRVIIPVLSSYRIDRDRSQRDLVMGLLWVESERSDALDQEDARMLGILANYIAEALDRIRRSREIRRNTGQDARRWILAAAAREICEPLQAAQTDLELLAGRIRSNETELSAQSFLTQLTGVTRYLENAVQAAVELRRELPDGELRLRAVNFQELVRDRCESFRGRASAAKCELYPHLDSWPNLIRYARLDGPQIALALDCILENALDAVEVQRDQKPDLTGLITVRLAVDSENRELLLSVVDNGCGIRPEHLPKIFDRYFTTKESTLRDGKYSMGLSQVKRLVEACGGEIEACNAPKGGAEFTLLFPIVQTEK